MTAAELIEALQKVPPDTEIMCRAGNRDLGNCWTPYAVELAFFGKHVPAVFLEHSLPSMWSGVDTRGANEGKPRQRGEILWTIPDEDESEDTEP